MGWTDEGYRDVAGILGDPEPANPDQLYITSNFGSTEMFALQQAAGYPKLADYLGAATPRPRRSPSARRGTPRGRSVAPASDSIITFSSATCSNAPGSWRKPAGTTAAPPPSYILGGECSRFWVHSGYPAYAYDTDQAAGGALPARQRPLRDRQRPAHQGGDVWAADAAVEIMRNESNWNGIFVTLPGVDKAAHMWGGVTDPGPTGADGDPMTHMAAATAEADRQVGKIMSRARRPRASWTTPSSSSPPTTAPSRASTSTASRSPTRDYGYYNWYYGDPENDARHLQPAAGRPAAARQHRQRRALLQRLDAAGLAEGPVRGQGRRGGRGHAVDGGRHRRVAAARRPLRPGLRRPLGPDEVGRRAASGSPTRRRSWSTPRPPSTGRT